MNSREPTVTAEELSQDGARLELLVPSGLVYFRGHFPGRPVLPGVVQLHWAVLLANRYLGKTGLFKGIRALKFQRIIVPDQSVELRLEYSTERRALSFSYSSDAGPHSSGRILFQ